MNKGIKSEIGSSICYTSYKGYRAVTLSGELYFVTIGVTIGTYNWTLDTSIIWITLHVDFTISSDHYIKDCLTNWNSIITGLLNIKTVL